MQSLSMLKALCGPDVLKNVLLVTTFWDKVGREEGSQRERKLTENPDFWGKMCKRGCRVMRHTNDTASAMSILEVFANRTSRMSKIALELQVDIVDDGKSLKDTRAGQKVAGEEDLRRSQEAHDKEVARISADSRRDFKQKDQQRERESQKMREAHEREEQANEKAWAKEQKKYKEKLAKMERDYMLRVESLKASRSRHKIMLKKMDTVPKEVGFIPFEHKKANKIIHGLMNNDQLFTVTARYGIHALCHKARQVLMSEPMLLELEVPIRVNQHSFLSIKNPL